MTHPTPCPDHERLRGLLSTGLPAGEQAELVAHLDSCDCCRRSLEEIATGGEPWSDAIRLAPPERPPPHSAFWHAVQDLEGLSPTRADVSASSGPADEEVALDFLQPPDGPGYVGKLGHFDVVGVIGRGGMGVVFRAVDPCLQREVAVKVLDPRLAGNETARKRFCREARAAASITHENVVAVHQVEREEANDLPFLVMQLVTGESLQDRLDRTGPPPMREVVRIGAQTAAGLAAAHARGLIHRDIKPANILLEEPLGRVKLTDFGLARAAEDVKLTQTGLVAGTPLYMAPEQARGLEVDHRADLFSLGSVLYTLCTGRPPFQGSTPFVVLKGLTEEPPRPIREINPDVPDWLVQVIDKLHAKEPADRYQSASEVAEVLAGRLARLDHPHELPAPAPARRSRPRPRRLWTLALGAPLVLAAGLFLSEWAGLTGLVRPRGPAPRAVLNAGTGPVRALAFSPGGDTLAVALENGTVKLWDLPTGAVRRTLEAHKGPVWSIAFSPDGKTLATTSSDMTVRLWDPATGDLRRTLEQKRAIRALAFDGDGRRLASGSRTGEVSVWDLKAGRELWTTPAHGGEVVSVAFADDGRTVASSSGDETVKLWDAAGGRERLTLRKHRGGVYSVAFAPGGNTLASGGWDHTVRLWDVASGENVATFEGHKQDVWAVAFSPDGRLLASAGEDHTVRLWDVAARRELVTFRRHTGTLYAVAFSPDGTTLASGGRDGAVCLWDAGAR